MKRRIALVGVGSTLAALATAATGDVIYETDTLQLHPGQSLVFYSDGITEALSPAGKMFGVAGIERSLIECTGEPDCAIQHITESMRKHEAGVRPNDDQTIVVMKLEEGD